MALTAPLVEEIRRLRAGRLRPSEIAQATGVSVRTVQAVIAGKADGRALSPRERFEDDERTGWAPLCMDAGEWADWRARLQFSGHHSELAARPCDDCPLGFAADMRAENRCNGTPGGVHTDDEPEEETMVDLSKIPLPQEVAQARTRRTALDVTAPPCGSCVHEPVCALRAAFEGMASIETSAPQLPDGLRLSLVAVVECDHFLRDKAKPAPVRVLTSQERGQANGAAAHREAMAAVWTPERRAAQGERARTAAAARKAATS